MKVGCHIAIRLPMRRWAYGSLTSRRALESWIQSHGHRQLVDHLPNDSLGSPHGFDLHQPSRGRRSMQCPRCRHENRSGAKFCEECAAQLARTCPNCGSQLSTTAKFCPECAYPVAGVTPGGRLASPEFYTPKDLLGRVTSKAALKGGRKQVPVLLADMKGSGELAGDERPMARPSSLVEPPGPTVAATPSISAIHRTPVIYDPPVTPAMAEASKPRRRSSEDAAAPEPTGLGQVPGIPWIAIGTGAAALVSLLIVALCTGLPNPPRAAVGDKPAVVPATGAAKTATASEPSSPSPTTDDPVRSAPKTPREADAARAPARPEKQSLSIRTSSTSRRAAAAPSASKADLAGRPRREPGKPEALGAGSAGARDDAEQARSRMTAARHAAERVAAGFYARNRFLSAQRKERDGIAAL